MVSTGIRYDPYQLLKNARVFGSLPDTVLTKLSAVARIEHYELPTLLHGSAVQVPWLRQVLAGSLDLVVRQARGEEVVLAEMEFGSWLPWFGVVNQQPMPYEIWSSAKAEFLALPAQHVRDVCAAHPHLYLAVMNEIGARMLQLMEWTAQSVLLLPEQRLAKLLHLLARAQGVSGNAGQLKVTQARLARLAACSRQSVNPLLNDLKSRGLIAGGYGKLQIGDMAALQRFSDSDLDVL